jgi:hypothetical protein
MGLEAGRLGTGATLSSNLNYPFRLLINFYRLFWSQLSGKSNRSIRGGGERRSLRTASPKFIDQASLDQIGSALDHFQTKVRAAAHPVSFIGLTGICRRQRRATGARSRRSIVIVQWRSRWHIYS